MIHYLMIRLLKFQSTLPRGERRPGAGSPASCHGNFNPRSHEGSDTGNWNGYGCSYISIHAPTRGATLWIRISTTIRIFQSTLPRGERPWLLCDYAHGCNISIHAPTRGATREMQKMTEGKVISIHAPMRGATAIFAKKFSFLSAKIV